nr:hypothetical protein [uncultured Rhodopila sp.]
MSAVHQLYAVVEQGNPFRIPDPPAPAFRFVELRHAAWTYAVYQGDAPQTRLLGYVRNCPEKCVWIARTTGSETAPADIRRWPSREAAAQWLSKAVDGTVPREAADRRFRTYGKRKTLAVTGLPALLPGTPARAAPGTNPESLDRHPERRFVLVTGEPDVAMPPLPTAQFPEPPKPSLPPPGEVPRTPEAARGAAP